MAEFLFRGYNVAVPEVDIGDDIFVVNDSDGEYGRVQVKTALATPTTRGYSARYALRFSQLQSSTVPDTWYVFVSRLETGWQSFIIIKQEVLYELYAVHSIGSLNQRGMLSLYFSYTEQTVHCGGQDLSRYLNYWADWPIIPHR